MMEGELVGNPTSLSGVESRSFRGPILQVERFAIISLISVGFPVVSFVSNFEIEGRI